MIISRTPFRISFFGGGTDYPVWYAAHGGCVLAASISRYCYISCRYLPPFFEHKYRAAYSIVEEVRSLDEIRHPSIRECLRFMNVAEGVEVHHDGDLPKQTGLGSSSSFTVGLLHVLHALKGNMVPPMQLAREAIHVERDLCRDNVGSQDQVEVAFGGLNHILFHGDGAMTVRPVTLSTERKSLFEKHLMLFFTGFSRMASEVAAEQIRNTPDKEAELCEMQDMVAEGLKILSGTGDIREFGKLLYAGWSLKKSLSTKVSNTEIDAIFECAMNAGAIGGKLCGAGGGGFMLLFVEPDRQAAVRKTLAKYHHVPFKLESLGSQIIFYEPVESAERKA